MPWAHELVIKLAGTVVCSRGEKGLLRNWPGQKSRGERSSYGCCDPDADEENRLWSPLGKPDCLPGERHAVCWVQS